MCHTAPELTLWADTKIDWDAYMRFAEQYLAGERDYSNLLGDTGPCVQVESLEGQKSVCC